MTQAIVSASRLCSQSLQDSGTLSYRTLAAETPLCSMLPPDRFSRRLEKMRSSRTIGGSIRSQVQPAGLSDMIRNHPFDTGSTQQFHASAPQPGTHAVCRPIHEMERPEY